MFRALIKLPPTTHNFIERDLAPLLGQLTTHESTAVRVASMRALGLLGEHAIAQIPQLINRFRENDSEVNDAVVAAVIALDLHTDAVPRLLEEQLFGDNRTARRRAAEVLGLLGPRAPDAVPLLVRALGDKNRFVRSAAAQALGRHGDPAKTAIPHLLDLFDDRYEHTREHAVHAIAALAQEDLSLPQTLRSKLLKGPDRSRAAAAHALGHLGEAATDQVGLLETTFTTERAADNEIAGHVAVALGSIGNYLSPLDQTRLTQLLLGHADNDKSFTKRGIAKALGTLGHPTFDKFSKLADFLGDQDADVRANAVGALLLLGKYARNNSLGELAKRSAELLAKVVVDRFAEKNHYEALHGLSELGVYSREQVPHLIDLPVYDINFNEAIRVALTAIWTAEPTPPIPSLVRYLHDGGQHGKDAAADALIFLKDRGGEQAPLLADVLSGDNDDVDVWEETAATRVLGRLGEYATPYVTLLARLAQDRKTDEKLRVAAIRALGVLGPHAKDHVPLLSQLLADRQAHSDVRVAAADALRAFAPRVKDQVEVDELAALLTPMAAHFEIFVVSDAVERALVDFGPIKLEDVPSILIHRYVHMEHTGRIRFLTHLLGGTDPAVTNLLDWVGGPARLGSTAFGEDTAAAEEIISILRNIWSSTQQYPAVRDDLVDKLEAVAPGTNWKRSHRELLTDVADDLDRANYHSEATAIRLSVREEPQSLTELGRLATALAAGHVLFWLLLIYVLSEIPYDPSDLFLEPPRAFVGGPRLRQLRTDVGTIL